MAVNTDTTMTLRMGNLHPEIKEQQLMDAFQGMENLISLEIRKDTLTGKSLGYGFLSFKTMQDAKTAIRKFNFTKINGKIITIDWTSRTSKRKQINEKGNLFVKNLPLSMDDVKLKDLFSEFGNTLSCKIARMDDGASLGYGYVQFEKEESANAAMGSGLVVEGKPLYIDQFRSKNRRHFPAYGVGTGAEAKVKCMSKEEEYEDKLAEEHDERRKQAMIQMYKNLDSRSRARVVSNMKFLKTCGIESTNLTTVMMEDPTLPFREESELQKLVKKVQLAGFGEDPCLLVCSLALYRGMSYKAASKKLAKSFGINML